MFLGSVLSLAFIIYTRDPALTVLSWWLSKLLSLALYIFSRVIHFFKSFTESLYPCWEWINLYIKVGFLFLYVPRHFKNLKDNQIQNWTHNLVFSKSPPLIFLIPPCGTAAHSVLKLEIWKTSVTTPFPSTHLLQISLINFSNFIMTTLARTLTSYLQQPSKRSP